MNVNVVIRRLSKLKKTTPIQHVHVYLSVADHIRFRRVMRLQCRLQATHNQSWPGLLSVV